MEKGTMHREQLAYLKKIEGQVRGVQKMIEDGRYCVDIITQLHSVIGAILRVEDKIFEKHLKGCVTKELRSGSKTEQQEKIEEVVKLMKRFRKVG